ncbi:hypothetical protein SLAVM298S_07390 [Streptomyces lavendulae subsp. lavendulae]
MGSCRQERRSRAPSQAAAAAAPVWQPALGDEQGGVHQVPFLPAGPARCAQFAAQFLQSGEQGLAPVAVQWPQERGEFGGAALADGGEEVVVGGVHRAAPVGAGKGLGVVDAQTAADAEAGGAGVGVAVTARRAIRVARACLQGPRRPR